MAESYLGITEAGTPDAKLHSYARTVGANTVEDEAIVLTEPHLAGYTVARYDIGLTTANKHLIQLMAGASLNVYVRRIEIRQYAYAQANEAVALHLYRLTAAGSGGTAITPTPLDPADAAAGASSQHTVATPGTTGAIVAEVGFQYVTSGLIAAPIVLDFERTRQKSLKIPAGTSNGIALVQGSANIDTSATISVDIWFDEWSA